MKTIENMSVTELKALAYDKAQLAQKCTFEVGKLNEIIASRPVDKADVKAAGKSKG